MLKKLLLRDFEAISAKYISKLTPRLIFPALRIGIFLEYFLIIFSSFLVNPVVPITTLFFSFETGELVSVESGYDHIKAASNAELSNIVPSKLDIAIIKRQEKIAPVYVWLDETSNIEKIVLPIRGYGLWGTLYGYLSLGPDLNSVMGIEYYEHKETPGLGGEVDNPNWKSGWQGKKIYNSEGSVSLKVVKGVSKDDYEIDGMSGATITSNGVTNMINFWLGDQGYGPIIKKLNEVIE